MDEMTDSQNTDYLFKNLEKNTNYIASQTQEINNYGNHIAGLEFNINQMCSNLPPQNTSSCQKQIDAIWQKVNEMKNGLPIQKRSLGALFQDLCCSLTEGVLSNGQQVIGIIPIVQHLINILQYNLNWWKCQMKFAQCGGYRPESEIRNLAQHCKCLATSICSVLKYITSVIPLMKHTDSFDSNQIFSIRSCLLQIFKTVVQSSTVFLKQPPMVCKNKLEICYGILSGIKEFGFDCLDIKAKCYVISEEVAYKVKSGTQVITNNNDVIGSLVGQSGIKICEVKVEEISVFEDSLKIYGAELKNVKIKTNKRKSEGKKSKASQAKYYLLFTTSFKFAEELFHTQTLSLPFMIAVHENQMPNQFARMLWDMSFSTGFDQIPLQGPEQVPWSWLAEAMQRLFFNKALGVSNLDDSQLNYLLLRLHNGHLPSSTVDGLQITFEKFAENKLKYISEKGSNRELNFSFSDWIHGILNMISEKSDEKTKVKVLWDGKYIQGFMSKSTAEEKLRECKEPTFLMRFSDNSISSISAAFLLAGSIVNHLNPFNMEEMKKYSLPTLIFTCVQLNGVHYLYKNISKNELEKYQPEQKANEPDYIGMYGVRTMQMNHYHQNHHLIRTNDRKENRTGENLLQNPVMNRQENLTLDSSDLNDDWMDDLDDE